MVLQETPSSRPSAATSVAFAAAKNLAAGHYRVQVTARLQDGTPWGRRLDFDIATGGRRGHRRGRAEQRRGGSGTESSLLLVALGAGWAARCSGRRRVWSRRRTPGGRVGRGGGFERRVGPVTAGGATLGFSAPARHDTGPGRLPLRAPTTSAATVGFLKVSPVRPDRGLWRPVPDRRHPADERRDQPGAD